MARRKAVARLEDPKVAPEEIMAAAEHGRAAVWELLRLFSSSRSEPLRQAAGKALARLWFLDQLVAEEEQAIVRRGYTVTWNARRRYPRALQAEIPIAVNFEVPFLDGEPGRIRPENLEWSHRVLGTRRATLEEFSPWAGGRGHATFTIVPGDFETNGPHRLVLQTRVRTTGLTGSWEFELPHVPFNLEFDPLLELSAITTVPDSNRDAQISQAIRLEPAAAHDGEPSTFLALGSEFAIRNPPRLTVTTPLPSDLAHAMSLEIEGTEHAIPAGMLILSGQGTRPPDAHDSAAAVARVPLGEIPSIDARLIERPGRRRVRWRSTQRPSAAGPTPKSDRSGRAPPGPTGSRSKSCGGNARTRPGGHPGPATFSSIRSGIATAGLSRSAMRTAIALNSRGLVGA